MEKEKAKGEKYRKGCSEFGSACSDFQGIFEKMKECCTGKENWIDCCEMMGGITKEMIEKCCTPKEEGNETND